MCRCYTLRDSEIRKPGQQRKMIKKDREVSMAYKRILTIQDISCVGQCSLTVALPILSACSLETAILPSAVLSTHTAGFHGFTFTDLTEEFPKIEEHWMRENISFSAVYTGYLGSVNQISYVKDIVKNCMDKDGTFIVDPAMADFGKLYPPFDKTYVEAMKQLCFDPMVKIILPNITEAAYLTDSEFREEYDEAYIKDIIAGLKKVGAFLGDGVEVGCNSVLNPGTIIGPNSNIYPLTSVRGEIPANSIVKAMDNIIKKRGF
jgi:pyridoxine kinase